MFLEYFKQMHFWEMCVSNVESPFMKLLQLDNLFFIKKVIKIEKAPPTEAEKTPIKKFVDELYNGSRESDLS